MKQKPSFRLLSKNGDDALLHGQAIGRARSRCEAVIGAKRCAQSGTEVLEECGGKLSVLCIEHRRAFMGLTPMEKRARKVDFKRRQGQLL